MLQNYISLLNITKDDLFELMVEAAQVAKQTQPQTEQKTLLSRSETAELLQVNLATIHRWTVSGKLNAKGIGGRVYYDREEVLNSVKSLK